MQREICSGRNRKESSTAGFRSKKYIAKSLNQRGCEVTVYPAHTTAEEIISSNPDGIMLSNGPGDPADCTSIIEEIKKIVQYRYSDLCNLPWTSAHGSCYRCDYTQVKNTDIAVEIIRSKDLQTNRVYISSQNHGYVVDAENVDPNVAVPAFTNVNDGTNEGLAYVGKNIFTVQFHPEACPGPQDSGYLFDRFIEMMGGAK